MNNVAREKLQKLFSEYAKKLPEKIAEIDSLWQEQKRHWNAKSWEDLYRYVHTLTGSSGTYGFQQISIAARQLLNLLKKSMEQAPNSQETIEIEAQLQILKTLLSNPADIQPQTSSLTSFEKALPNQNRLIYFLGRNENLTQQLDAQLNHFDYDIQFFSDPSALKNALNQMTPATMIMDISKLSDEDHNFILSFIGQYRFIPLIVIADKDSLQDHLKAVRMGSKIFFAKPLEVNLVIDKLNFIFDAISNPYRILIIDDTLSVAEYFATILQQAGMYASILTDPFQINQALMDSKPELILLDLYMPQISGLELASVLRQQPTYASIPIVFLSAEDDKTKQLEAMSIGGDDFITKPVRPEYLIWSVRNRAQRYRVLRTLMTKDSLTGLFNHTNILLQLEIELLRAQRQNTPFCFVIIDLDHFKSINDTYGHLIGDRVLKTLSLLLQQRLRGSDIIGRYGGEEFALIFPNTSYDDAFTICENLRENFINLRHNSGKKEFTVTFSAGIATAPPYLSATALIETADKALYKAKNAGRNRTV